MKSIRDYSIARLMVVGFGLGIAISTLHLAINAVFPSSEWTPLVTGAAAGLVISGVLAYFSTAGRDEQLLPRRQIRK